jgi:transposase
MPSAASENSSNTPNVAMMNTAQLVRLVESQAEKIASLEHQLDWFRRQIFGKKSERFAPEPDPSQMHLGESFASPTPSLEERKVIPAHTRRVSKTDGAESGEELKFFDESKVPVQTIILMHADLEGVPADQYEVIAEKVTYRLAQRPGSYQVLKYLRPVVKLKSTAKILCLPAPTGFLEESRADVSFAAGLLMDKFAWHRVSRTHQL